MDKREGGKNKKQIAKRNSIYLHFTSEAFWPQKNHLHQETNIEKASSENGRHFSFIKFFFLSFFFLIKNLSLLLVVFLLKFVSRFTQRLRFGEIDLLVQSFFGTAAL